MTPDEVVDRILVCVEIGSVDAAAALLHAHGNESAVAEALVTSSPDVLAWAYHSAPIGSVVWKATAAAHERMGYLPLKLRIAMKWSARGLQDETTRGH